MYSFVGKGVSLRSAIDVSASQTCQSVQGEVLTVPISKVRTSENSLINSLQQNLDKTGADTGNHSNLVVS